MSSTTRSVSAIKEARELYELKERAAKFYAENGVPAKMEDVLNSMFYDNPQDVYGHLVNYFQKFAKPPVITRVEARKAVDGKGQNTIQTDIFCTVNNNEKLVSSSVNPSVNPFSADTGKAEDMEEEMKEREANVEAAIALITKDVSTKLCGLEPTQQQQIDALVREIYKHAVKPQVRLLIPDQTDDQQSDDYVVEVKSAKERQEKNDAEQQGNLEAGETDKKPGSSLSKTDKPKSGKETVEVNASEKFLAPKPGPVDGRASSLVRKKTTKTLGLRSSSKLALSALPVGLSEKADMEEIGSPASK